MEPSEEANLQEKTLCQIGHNGALDHNVMENRRSANYKPDIWKYDFLQSLTTKYDKEEFGTRFQRLMKEAKCQLFVGEIDQLSKLELISTIQNLGLTNHFQEEIKEFLETLISVKNNNNTRVHDHGHVYSDAKCFRILRQNGYDVSPDKLGAILLSGNENEWKKRSTCNEIKALIELIEASCIAMESENILEEVRAFAISCLKGSVSTKLVNSSDEFSKQIMVYHHALELPSHWRVEWFQVKRHIKDFEQNHMNHILLELAKINFNIVQTNLQDELKELSRWWKNLGLEKELNFARNRMVESFMCASGVSYEPKFKSLRRWLTKVINFVLVIDDIYDAYASFEELKQFTITVDCWDAKELQKLPKYMMICFQALNDVTIETALEISRGNNMDKVLPHIKQAWKDFCKSLYVEAKWYKKGHIPYLQEYLNNAWISSSGPVILLHVYFSTLYQPTHDINNFLLKNQDFIFNVSLIIRLCNDLGTSVAERERGDAASSIVCYMNQMDVTEEEARRHIEDIIKRAWKKINEHFFITTHQLYAPSEQEFVNQAMNAARVAHTLYQNNVDGFGIQDGDFKKLILSLLIEPFLDI